MVENATLYGVEYPNSLSNLFEKVLNFFSMYNIDIYIITHTRRENL